MRAATRLRPTRRQMLMATPVAALVVLVSISLALRGPGGDTTGALVSPAGPPRMVFAEFGLNEDRIYSAPADAPEDRTLHASVPHAPGWGLNPALTTSSSLFAYTILPRESPPERGAPAELWVLDITTRNLTRLARDADLLAPAVFVDDGAALVYRRSQGSTQEVVRVEVGDLTRQVVHREQTSFGIFPLGLDPRGDLLFTRISPEGTDLYVSRPGGETERLFRASDDIARDWRISPDGGLVSFLAPVIDGERAVHRARLVSLTTLEELTPVAGDGGATALAEQYSPVWSPDGSAITLGQEAAAADSQPAVVLGLDGSREVLPPPEHGFDVPLAWSSDGRYLVVRSFDGRNSNDPGVERTVLVDREGARTAVEVASEVIFLGWYRSA